MKNLKNNQKVEANDKILEKNLNKRKLFFGNDEIQNRLFQYSS
jgi:hypothetical protein